MADSAQFKLTYSTMFNPPPELHAQFDAALQGFRRDAMGRDWPMWIGGQPVAGSSFVECRSPINQDWLIGRFADAGADEVDRAVRAAHAAWPAWAATPWRERVALLRRAARLIEQRVYAISAAVALEVGKNRMESIGEVQETADLIDWYCEQMEAHDGFDRVLPDDPLPNFRSHNRTVLRPYGAWAVIAPFNFPFALAGGPLGPALVAGNTAVFKGSPETSLSGWLLLECLRDAGLPPGVINFVTGGDDTGRALVQHPQVAGITFTGSHAVGMQILRQTMQGRYPRPCITEMGGKNATIVSRHADLERAALGILRSAFGLSGQKCSACSRVYVERPVADALRERLVQLTHEIAVGDPTQQANWMGPVISRAAYERYERLAEHLRRVGQVDAGGQWLTDGELAHGFFVAPTVARAPLDDAAWIDEHFLPLVLVGEVDSVDEGIARANASDYGLTAGFYGAADEVAHFHERIEAGVTYANRPQGATTGAWPGYQPFGGWKGSGSTGKAIGSFHYLQQYLREQSRTVVE
ncbi:aldehyde dehydrogenase family protein [Ottowia sp.]|uniref:aldehyde dehydrogenase family protein n=1 Tax=Ottowia sp. TaxID=1898956 RepID=UPI002D19A9C3|nr:aldehyde dehydrogenase family protein [Ottowia sp.]HRN75851.1 aldehyde dehydrogenase family protein [Ottowia sp.]HRQ03195.1 aldehyde dehydrogenase family protein [Ottowia sp.]